MAKVGRRKNKGGRPRKAGAPREASGKICRAWSAEQTERAALETAVAARMKHYSVDESDARDQRLSTFVGRLARMGQDEGGITMDQYHASQKYLEVLDAFHRATGTPPNFVQPRPETEGGGDWEGFVKSAKERYLAMREVLGELQFRIRSPAPISALDVLVVRDVEHWPLVVDLRSALNALSSHFFEGRRKAA